MFDRQFVLTMVIMGLLLAFAFAVLILRDRITMYPEMSSQERAEAVQRNTQRTFHWWHVAALLCVLNILILNLSKVGHQKKWHLIAEAAVAAFLVLRYYRTHPEERIQPPPSSENSTPLS